MDAHSRKMFDANAPRLAVLSAVLAIGCVGQVSPGDGTAGPAADPGLPSGTGSGSNIESPLFVPPSAGIKRLTVREYRNTLRELFAEAADLAPPIEADAVAYGYTTVGAASSTVSLVGVEQFEAAALALADRVFGDASARVKFVGCEVAAATDACSTQFLSSFAARAWRRPLREAELARYTDLASRLGTEFADPWQGLKYAVSGFLQSPHFVYRVELGEPDPQRPLRLRYTNDEMAQRLSYSLWGAPPDAQLVAAARAGSLLDATELQNQVKRLLASERVEPQLRVFFSEYLMLADLEHLSKDAQAFPAYKPELAAGMRAEIEHALLRVAYYEPAPFSTVLHTTETYVNAPLAQLYGLEIVPPSGMSMTVTLPAASPRRGLLGFAAILAMHSREARTSPTLRGKFIREQLLCQQIQPAPANVDTKLPEPSPQVGLTLRERVAQHSTNPECAGCHQLMDPLGLALENFDGIGRYRSEEGGIAIDASGSLDGVTFSDVKGLAEAIQAHPQFPGCVVRQLYRFTGSHKEADSEQPVLDALTAGFLKADQRFSSLLSDIVVSDGFRYAVAPAGTGEL